MVVWTSITVKKVRNGWFGNVFYGSADGLDLGHVRKKGPKSNGPNSWVNGDVSFLDAVLWGMSVCLLRVSHWITCLYFFTVLSDVLRMCVLGRILNIVHDLHLQQ